MDQALLLLAVVETGGFTAAASRLGVSKGFVSKQVAALESALGLRLLHRTTRRVSPTEAGRLYLAYARQARDLLADGERAVSSVRTEVDGRLRITAPTSFGEGFMVDLLGDFMQRHPRVSFDVDLSIVSHDLIGEGYDFALRQSRTIDPSLVARPLGTIRERIVISPRLLAQRFPDGVASPGQLAHVDVLRNNHFRDEGAWVLERGQESIQVPVQGSLAINSYIGIRRAVAQGLGAARLPYYLVKGPLEQGELVELLPEWRLPPTPLFLVYPSREHLPHRARVFRDFVLGWFADPERQASLN